MTAMRVVASFRGRWLGVDGRGVDVHYRDLDAVEREIAGVWWGRAEMTFSYALANHASYGRMARCAGLVARAASQAAHAVLAACGQWITNEKQFLTRAGLWQVDEFIALPEPDVLREITDRSRALCAGAVKQARATVAPA